MGPLPLYQHNCEYCVYLGNYQDRENTRFELYFCCQDPSSNKLIAHYGEGDNFTQCHAWLPAESEQLRTVIGGHAPCLLEAYYRAKARKLVKAKLLT